MREERLRSNGVFLGEAEYTSHTKQTDESKEGQQKQKPIKSGSLMNRIQFSFLKGWRKRCLKTDSTSMWKRK